uniref:Uncharacterized protein n=1 Tax=Anguilla anguilla TaxID=7936 RepID=A0A0E9W8G7_ANGAN
MPSSLLVILLVTSSLVKLKQSNYLTCWRKPQVASVLSSGGW